MLTCASDLLSRIQHVPITAVKGRLSVPSTHPLLLRAAKVAQKQCSLRNDLGQSPHAAGTRCRDCLLSVPSYLVYFISFRGGHVKNPIKK